MWLDVEDDCQKIGRKLIEIINTYAAVIEKAGYKCGIYTGQSFYNSYIKPYVNSLSISHELLWIARYYKGYDSMHLKDKVNENYKPLEDIAGGSIRARE